MMKVTKAHKERVSDTINLIIRFLRTRPDSYLRLCDLWSLIKAKYPNDENVAYWRARNKQKHGMPPAVSVVLQADERFIKTKFSPKRVYIELKPSH